MGLRGMSAALLAASVAFLPWRSATAAEAFLCGTDSVVYVEIEDLETAKRTNPCVAAYFGLKVKSEVKASPLKREFAAAPAPPAQLPFRTSLIDTSVPARPVAKPLPVAAPIATREIVSPTAGGYGPVRIINASTSQNIWVPPANRPKPGDRERVPR